MLPIQITSTLQENGVERRDKRKIGELNSITPDTPLTIALSLLLDAGVSTLPVVSKVCLLISLPFECSLCIDLLLSVEQKG